MPSLANVAKVRVCSICTKKIEGDATECEDGHPVGRPTKEDSYFIELPLEPQLKMVIEGSILIIIYEVDRAWHYPNVPVKSKLKHPPPGIPRAFDVFSCPGGREFDEVSLPGVGHLITAHRGWGIWSLDSISYYESRWFHVAW